MPGSNTGIFRKNTGYYFNTQEAINSLALSIDIGILGMLLDELPPWWNLISHEHGEDPVGFSSTVNGDLPQCPVLRIHGGIPQLFCIHFTKTLVSLNVNTCFLSSTHFLNEC